METEITQILTIEVRDAADGDELDLVIDDLRRELEDLGVTDVVRSSLLEEMCSGTRSGTLTYTSELLVAFGSTVGMVTAIVELVKVWRKRRDDAPSVIIHVGSTRVEIDDGDSDHVRNIVDAINQRTQD